MFNVRHHNIIQLMVSGCGAGLWHWSRCPLLHACAEPPKGQNYYIITTLRNRQ